MQEAEALLSAQGTWGAGLLSLIVWIELYSLYLWRVALNTDLKLFQGTSGAGVCMPG